MREANTFNLKVGDKVIPTDKAKSYLAESYVTDKDYVYGIVNKIDPSDDTCYTIFVNYKGLEVIGLWLGILKDYSEILFYESY